MLLSGFVNEGFASCALGRVPLAAPRENGPSELMLRPEQIHIDAGPEEGAARAQVVGVTYYGHDARVVLSLAGGADRVIARVVGHVAPTLWSHVWLKVEGAAMAHPNPPNLADGKSFVAPSSATTQAGVEIAASPFSKDKSA